MSAAIMSRFDFGDSSILKNMTSNRDSSPNSLHLDLGSSGMRLALTRMASSPATGSNSTHAQSISMILGNLAAQHQQQQQQQQQQQHQQQLSPQPHQVHHRRLERTQSAPAPASALQSAVVASAAAATVNTSRYKTELCRPYEEFGICKYGDKCQFAHGGAELRSLARHPKYKTELCRTYHTIGFCPYGPRCHFVHNQEEVVGGQKTPLVALRSGSSLTSSTRSRPVALSPTLSLDSASPSCSLSQSPTSSMGSFFCSEPELHSPNSNGGITVDEQRLPVFNRLSTVQILSLGNIVMQ